MLPSSKEVRKVEKEKKILNAQLHCALLAWLVSNNYYANSRHTCIMKKCFLNHHHYHFNQGKGRCLDFLLVVFTWNMTSIFSKRLLGLNVKAGLFLKPFICHKKNIRWCFKGGSTSDNFLRRFLKRKKTTTTSTSIRSILKT